MKLDSRLMQITLELTDSTTKVFSGLSMHATGVKLSNGIQNEVVIKIANLSKEDRDFVMSQISPYNNIRTKKKVIVEAGRESTGLSRIFLGDLIRGEISQPPDSTLTLRAKTAAFFRETIVSNSFGPAQFMSFIATQVAADLGLTLRFEATDKLVKNFVFDGAASKQVNLLGDMGGVNAYVNDDLLIVKDKNVPLKNSLRKLSQATGMIGIPTLDIQGVSVKFLLDEHTRMGGALEIESKIYPAANGVYNIYKLSFNIASRDTPWYWLAEAKRQETT